MNDSVIQIENIGFRYHQQPVLEGLSLKIQHAEFSAVIGPNGAGKSTLVKLIGGILQPSTGSVSFKGKKLESFSRENLARSMAYVPQETEFAFDYKVREVVRMGRYPYLNGAYAYSASDERIVDESLELMDIGHFAERGINELSGGEKQRVIVAGALAQQPQVLLLDEPTAALDLRHQVGIYKILRQLNQKKKLTVFIVTHDLNLAAQFCKRIVLIDKGKLIADGKPEEVLQFKQIQDIFGVKVYIDINPLTNSLYVLPYA